MQKNEIVQTATETVEQRIVLIKSELHNRLSKVIHQLLVGVLFFSFMLGITILSFFNESYELINTIGLIYIAILMPAHPT